MKAIIDNLTAADATADQVIRLEGNPYFPADSIGMNVAFPRLNMPSS